MRTKAVLLVAAILVTSCQLLLQRDTQPVAGSVDAQVDVNGDGSPNDSSLTDASGDASCAPPNAGPCTDTDTNSHHCGSCYHDCLGGACVAGKCQPVVVLSGLLDPTHIAVEPEPCGTGHVAWTANTCPNDGGHSELHLATKDGVDAGVVDENQCFLDLEATPQQLLWGTYNRVQLTNWDGTAYGLVGNTTTAAYVALVGDYVYWGSPYESWIFGNKKDDRACSGTGCGVLGVGGGIYDLASTPQGLVFLRGTPDSGPETSGVYRMLDGGRIGLLAPNQEGARSMIASGDSVYWVRYKIIHHVLASGSADDSVINADANALAADERGLFWSTGADDGAIWTCDLKGKNPRALATGQNHPADITLDAQAIYWVNEGSSVNTADGQLMKLARE